MTIFIGWLVFAILVGWFWDKKGLSFSSGFIWSLLLSPIVGFIIGLVRNTDIKKQDEANSAIKIIGYIITLILVIFGVLFLLSARAEYTQNPGSRLITGLVLISIGIVIIIIIKMNQPQPGQKIEIIQKIDLAGKSLPEQMKCKQCGAPLSKDTVTVKEGAVFINCQYCQSTYQITEEPKW